MFLLITHKECPLLFKPALEGVKSETPENTNLSKWPVQNRGNGGVNDNEAFFKLVFDFR